MSNALGAFFVFIFICLGCVGFITVMAFITENNAPVASVANNVSEYIENSSVVNHTLAFEQNVTAQTTTAMIPLPTLAMIFCIAAGVMVFLILFARRKR